MEKKKNNPFVGAETCKAYREGFETLIEERTKTIEEKIKSLGRQIAIGFSVSSFIIVVVQFYLSLR